MINIIKTVNILNDDTGIAIAYRGYLNSLDTKDLFRNLMKSEWRQEQINMMGKIFMAKRLLCTYGDPGITYSFSGKTETCVNWNSNEGISVLKKYIETITGIRYNYAIVNLYENHNSKLGYHSDKESDMDPRYCICSVSLGATREFRIQPITKKFTEIGRERPKLIKVNLEDGDILIMGGNIQKFWKHAVLESKQPCGPRINITFRVMYNN